MIEESEDVPVFPTLQALVEASAMADSPLARLTEHVAVRHSIETALNTEVQSCLRHIEGGDTPASASGEAAQGSGAGASSGTSRAAAPPSPGGDEGSGTSRAAAPPSPGEAVRSDTSRATAPAAPKTPPKAPPLRVKPHRPTSCTCLKLRQRLCHFQHQRRRRPLATVALLVPRLPGTAALLESPIPR